MSNIGEEKILVSKLRNEGGMTLQEIANELNRSIFWVKSRLDNNYEPKRARRTSTSENIEDYVDIKDPKLSGEVDQVKRLREEGLTYEQIATQLGRSIYWVHTRLRSKYRPRVTLNEKNFQETRVIPWLVGHGHKIIGQYVRSKTASFIQEADIISHNNGMLVITEVKVSVLQHQFQTAIGQLLLHKVDFEDEKNIRLQIALPLETRNDNFTDELINYIEKNVGINLLYIP